MNRPLTGFRDPGGGGEGGIFRQFISQKTVASAPSLLFEAPAPLFSRGPDRVVFPNRDNGLLMHVRDFFCRKIAAWQDDFPDIYNCRFSEMLGIPGWFIYLCLPCPQVCFVQSYLSSCSPGSVPGEGGRAQRGDGAPPGRSIAASGFLFRPSSRRAGIVFPGLAPRAWARPQATSLNVRMFII